MSYSRKERIAHVYRRLGVGSHPDLIANTATVEDAIARSLELGHEEPPMDEMEPPLDRESATDIATLAGVVTSWLETMASSPRVIEQRLVWFWHDHFATAVQKVRIPYLFWVQHQTVRSLATGSFTDLLHAVSTDPAMLLYLDGARNHRDGINENYAREVMELHTMGTGNYSQKDITEAARALTGWVVNAPYGRSFSRGILGEEPWAAVFAPFRHDNGIKTVLGVTADFEPGELIDLLLEQPATAEFISTKLYKELVGLQPEPTTVAGLAADFRADYSIMGLVEAIVCHPVFVSDEAVRSKVRTPVERLVAIAQGLGTGEVTTDAGLALHMVAYLPFNPPSPAGYPKGSVLLGPHQLVHSFDFLAATKPQDLDTQSLIDRLGIPDITEGTRAVIDAATDPATRTALAVNSPEFALV